MGKYELYQNKIAIVTGGGSGIGRAICVFLAKHGATVIIADLNLDAAKETSDLIAEQNGISDLTQVDVSDQVQIKQLIEGTFEKYGKIDFLFNNAGISINGEFQDITLDHWRNILDVNLWGTVYGTYYAYPIMQRQNFGQIVNTASLAGLIPGGLTTPYSASKHAVVGFTLTLRGEAKQYGIKINALCPGYLRTNIQKTTPNVTDYMNSEKNKQTEENLKVPTADDVIEQIMKGVRKNRAIIISPKKHKKYYTLHRLFPALMPRVWHMMIRSMKKDVSSSE